ncbi:glycoside hydrolase family 2 TIM barrel-domain containing protein [uncultured Vagococcus sp.]|uniref:glycoside hydrolase family 2 TIM barrel-domain containing protein n=1 Tax=uncultured Vagococcus sp. TaxID=189676 RepID=UPI0028D25B53|nr:glycoside hydrolase family 2 TIM barrel-domain containing protein [uncultured Vagococcus sp.]
MRERNMPLRSRFNYYQNLASALAYNEEQSDYYTTLAGEWQFLFLKSPQDTPAGFIQGAYNALEWDKIQVPSQLEFAGYGQPIYANIDYPFPVDPPYVPYENPTGLYYRKFSYNKQLDQQILRFDGVESTFEVWLNQQYLGKGQGSRLMTEFDITEMLKEGENELAVRVNKWSVGSYLEDQDMWWLSGIMRDVSIVEEGEINDLKITPFSKGDNWFIDVAMSVETAASFKGHLYFQGERVSQYKLGPQAAIEVVDPLLWNQETPNLYCLVIELNQELFIPIRFGLREIQMIDQLMCLNGLPILFNGVNRHEFHPKKGRCLSRADIWAELCQIKRYHINAIRTAHYPNTPYFYDVCDELGLLVIDECDIETHGFPEETTPAKDPFWQSEFIARGLRMVHRDYNHPSIVIWSLGNESHFGENFVAMAAAMRKLDSSRLLHYEGDRHCQVTDMYSTMYSSLAELEKRASQKMTKKPHILCEYAHAMGNGPGNLQDYQELFNLYDSLQGGFIWEWKDHGIYNEEEQNYLYGGCFNESVHDGDFVLDGLVLPDGTPSPGLLEYRQVIQPVSFHYNQGQLLIRNKYDHQPLKDLRVKIEVVTQQGVVLTEEQPLSLIEPGGYSQVMAIDCPNVVTGYLTVSLIVDQGTAIFPQETVFAQDQFAFSSSQPVKDELEVVETSHDLTISGATFTLGFNKSTGNLASFVKGNRELLASELAFSLSRMTISNDVEMQKSWHDYYLNELYTRSESFDFVVDRGTVILFVNQSICPPVASWGVKIRMEIWVNDQGISYQVRGWFEGEKPAELPRIGWELPLLEPVTQIAWFGKGPGESYPDSQQHTLIGHYRLSAKEWRFPYIIPQETGNRSEVSQSRLSLDNGQELLLSSVGKFNLNVIDLVKEQNQRYRYLEEKAVENRGIRVDLAVRGLGSNSCGPVPLRKDTVYSTPFTGQFTLA